MLTGKPTVLEKLSEFQRMPQELKGRDLRGREVVNPAGNVVGHVDDVFVDASNNEARLARLFLTGTHGRAVREVLIPIEDIEELSDEQVRIRAVAAGV